MYVRAVVDDCKGFLDYLLYERRQAPMGELEPVIFDCGTRTVWCEAFNEDKTEYGQF